MSKGYYAYTTKGSETLIHWVGPPAKSIGRFVDSGPMGFPPGTEPHPAEPARDKPKKKRKKKGQ